ncbi:phosphoribosylanthranilate isomerase [Bacillus massiliglaciei]|uniref:phosphoribosylanthranilate isomerase n=1 Tax=Bacillus massiliglaciei TaxID=1816693 RepID=UPI000A63848B|nr:phosphoribosylanthranilate isomerase [Bacillus massiliglaciei]
MLVKICGIQTAEAGRLAAEAGADLLGFIFADSSRRIEPEDAASIINQLPGGTKTVGVFMNQEYEEVIRTAAEAGVDFIQLHGSEPEEFARELPYPVIKAWSIRTLEDLKAAADYPAEFHLLDLPKEKQAGSRKTLDWVILKDSGLLPEKILLAGGLTPENVGKAIQSVSPAGVDVASGVETEGKKDPKKIRDFIKMAKKPIREDEA